MITQSLTGPWQFRQMGTSEWLPAQAPGNVHTDLLAAGRIPDPFVGENERQVKWVAAQTWEYQREFTAEPDLLSQERIFLVCDGLDTLAELILNGQRLGRTDNMFRKYRWDVTELIRPGVNTLSIVFSPYAPYIKARQKAHPMPGLMNAGAAHLRKAPSHFGWDWGPSLPTSGIWRDIYLEGYRTARLTDVHLRQAHDDGQVTLSIAAECEHWEPASLTLTVTLTDPDGAAISASVAMENNRARLTLLVENPQLWWPNGLGAQPLYHVAVNLQCGRQCLDTRCYQTGLRTVELRQMPDDWGQSFTFVVNGVPIFAKGANWIPVDTFPTRVTAERLEHLIRSAAAAHMNMLRVWGGGYYEDEGFYDLCDRYGILIWQDFMFACAAYPLDEGAFRENVRLEVIETVRRLRHRACLALWCGNNEIESQWPLYQMSGNAQISSLKATYFDFFHQRLPEWMSIEDPDHAYWPSSPSKGTFDQKTKSGTCGDTHEWQVWHGLQPAKAYRTSSSRFASEFGMQSLPTLDTIAAFAQSEDHRLNSKVMRHHQRSVGGNGKLMYYLAQRFRLPRYFANYVYLTQIVQAETVRAGVEHWRRNRPRCSGALYWQLNDCWPGITWASIDYNGHWKALHYAARRFFAPVALSLEDNGTRVTVHIANDTLEVWRGQMYWSLETLGGTAVDSGQEMFSASALAATRLHEFDFTAQLRQYGREKLVFVVELWQDSQCVSRQVLAFAPERVMLWPDPGLTVDVENDGDRLILNLSAGALARFVALWFSGVDVVFSDNYFDLPAGRSMQVTCPLPQGWTVAQARQALRVRSLADVRWAGRPILNRLRGFSGVLNPTTLATWAVSLFTK